MLSVSAGVTVISPQALSMDSLAFHDELATCDSSLSHTSTSGNIKNELNKFKFNIKIPSTVRKMMRRGNIIIHTWVVVVVVVITLTLIFSPNTQNNNGLEGKMETEDLEHSSSRAMEGL
jgi:uncharacterized membrane protein